MWWMRERKWTYIACGGIDAGCCWVERQGPRWGCLGSRGLAFGARGVASMKISTSSPESLVLRYRAVINFLVGVTSVPLSVRRYAWRHASRVTGV